MKTIIFLSIFLLSTFTCFAQQHYKVTLLRANPGDLLELIDELKSDRDAHAELGIDKPYLIRHSQGDHWDLMLIYPIADLETYFSAEKSKLRTNSKTLEKDYGDSYHRLVSFQEESIVSGPEKAKFVAWFEEYNLFHIEIFTALAGKQAELLKQREMENVFYSHINHRPNMIFTRVFGPSWDSFTIGAYADLMDYANDGGITIEQEDVAAKKAGFQGVNYIGSYLRSLLLEHHDTLAGKVN
jgi:hypothetical protein